MHGRGDTWVEVWHGSDLPLAIVPHGDSVGYVTIDSNGISCDGEHITEVRGNSVGGLAYTAADVPLVTWLPRFPSSDIPLFAFKTNRWHVESIPGPAGVGGVDIEVGDNGQVVIVYSTEDSGLWCARGADVVGVENNRRPQDPSRKPEPTILSGASSVGRLASSVVFDAMGRRVVNPRSGVFFIRGEGQGAGDLGRPRKVVVQR